MHDERNLSILGKMKHKFSIYVIILAIVSIGLKILLNDSNILIDGLAEIVVLIGLIITNLTKPKEDFEDERVINNINNHYNKAFKIILPISMLSYLLSVVLLFKFGGIVFLPPNLFINLFLFLIFIGIIILVKRHNIYLNNKFLGKEDYFINIFKIIGIGIIVSVFTAIILVFLNIIIFGENVVNLALLLMVLLSFINLSVQYLLYSIYEYNHYNESIDIDNGKIPIVTRNMFLYFGIIAAMSFITTAYSLITIRYILNMDSSTVGVLGIRQYLNGITTIYSAIFLVIITYSLKASLLRLKDSSLKKIKVMITLTNIYAIVIIASALVAPLLNYLINSNSHLFGLIQTISVWLNVVLSIFYIIVLIYRYNYASEFNFPHTKLLAIPIIIWIISLASILLHGLILKLFGNAGVIIFSELLSAIMSLILFSVNLIIISKYSKPYEIREVEM